ncbi:cupin domain-containing protein [Natrialbaceae archaeon A-gly3]
MEPTDDLTPTETAMLADCADRTRTQLFEGEPRTVRLSLEAGEALASHRHPDRRIVFYVIEGEVAVTLSGTEYRLEADELLRFDGDQEIEPEALEDSVALLVLASRV